MDKLKNILVSVWVIAITGLTGFLLHQPKPIQPSLGSVIQGSEYHSQSVLPSQVGPGGQVIKTAPGTFGSVIVTATGTGSIVFYDTTTTNVNLRTGQVATSSLTVVAQLDANQPAGTYTYDSLFFNGLVGVISGSTGTSTITYR